MAIPKRRVIIKIPNGSFVKYKSRNIVTLVQFCQKKFGGFRWMNVYDDEGNQIANFTKNNPPTLHV